MFLLGFFGIQFLKISFFLLNLNARIITALIELAFIVNRMQRHKVIK